MGFANKIWEIQVLGNVQELLSPKASPLLPPEWGPTARRKAPTQTVLSAPPAPPRLRLVAGPGSLQCAGAVEFYSGRLGGPIGYEAPNSELQELGARICRDLGCGSLLKWLPGAEVPGPIQWTVRNASCETLPKCFQRAPPRVDSQALALVCSGECPAATPGRGSADPHWRGG